MITQDPMSRNSRIDAAGAIQHVMVREIERETVFLGVSDNYVLAVVFENGERGHLDIKPILDFGVFERIKALLLILW